MSRPLIDVEAIALQRREEMMQRPPRELPREGGETVCSAEMREAIREAARRRWARARGEEP